MSPYPLDLNHRHASGNINLANMHNKIISDFKALNACELDIINRNISSDERKLFSRLVTCNQDISPKVDSKDIEALSHKMSKILLKTIDYDSEIRFELNKGFLDTLIHEIVDWIAFHIFDYMSAERFSRVCAKSYIRGKNFKGAFVSFNELLDLISNERRKANSLDTKINIRDILIKKGKSLCLKSMCFSNDLNFSDVDFNGISFYNCSFIDVHFNKMIFSNVHFKNCKFHYFSFKDCHFINTSIDNSCFIDGCIIDSSIKGLSYNHSYISKVNFDSFAHNDFIFNKSKLSEVILNRSSLDRPSTIIEKNDIINFRSCNIEESVFFNEGSCLFDECKIIKSSKPMASILVNPVSKGLSGRRVQSKASDNILLKLDYTQESAVGDLLNKEVIRALKKLTSHNLDKSIPIPQLLINELIGNHKEYKLAYKLYKKVKAYAHYIDMVILPGSDSDIPPLFYGEKKDRNSDFDGNYKRALIEIFLINEAKEKGIPIVGICRGFQAIAVFYGAALNQHVGWEFGVQEYTLKEYGAVSEINSFVWHHQGVDPKRPPKQRLKPVCEYNGMIKALQCDEGGASPMVLVQFHPEFYKPKINMSWMESLIQGFLSMNLSKGNKTLWKDINHSAQQNKHKKEMLKELKNKVKLVS